MLMDNSQVGLCLMHCEVDFKHIITGLKTRVLRVNQTFLEMSGYSEEEVLAWDEKEAMKVVHPKDRPGFKSGHEFGRDHTGRCCDIFTGNAG